jgi:hypothetical protein
MVKVFIKPNRKGLSSIKRVSLKEPLSREHLIEKTIPYDSYVAKRMRELGVYDMGLTPLQIASVQKDLIDIYGVKKSLDKTDVMEAVNRSQQNQLAKETKAVLGEVRDYQKQLVDLKQQKNDLNASKVKGKTEIGLQANEKEILSRPQEQLDTRQTLELNQKILPYYIANVRPNYAGDEEVDFSAMRTPPSSLRMERCISEGSLRSQARREGIGAESPRPMIEELPEEFKIQVPKRRTIKKLVIREKLSEEKQEGKGMGKVVMPNAKFMRPPIYHPMSLRI